MDDDNIIINKATDGFDSNMQAYAFIINHEDKKYMFFNGNNYGFDGIGYATIK